MCVCEQDSYEGLYLRLRKWVLLYLNQLKLFILQNFVTVKGRRFEMYSSESSRIIQSQKMGSASQGIYKKDRQCTYQHNIEARSRNNSCRRKAVSIKCSECLCSLGYPASRKHASYYSHLWPYRLCNFFARYLVKRLNFWNKVIENKMCFHSLYNFVWNISQSKKNWGNIIINIIYLRVMCTLFLSYFNKTCIFSTHIREILKFHENPSKGGWMFPFGRTDRQTWLRK